MGFKTKNLNFHYKQFLLLTFFLSSCAIQKRKYSDGFYVGERSSVQTHTVIKKAEATRIILPPKTKYKQDETGFQINEMKTVFNYDITASISKQNITPIKIEKRVVERLTNQIIKKPIDDKPLPVKKRLELFSKLSLIALLINIGLAISIVFIVVFFTFPQVVIALVLLNLFAPLVSLVLALEGKWRIKQHPEKYKRPQLADIVQFASILLILLSLFYLSVMVLVAGVLVAGW